MKRLFLRLPLLACSPALAVGCLLTAGGLLGCSWFGPKEPPPGYVPTTSRYACSDFVLEVRFRHPDEITIAGRGEVAMLERGEGQVGDRYRGDGFTFWTEGPDRAYLQLPAGQIRDCFRIRDAEPSS